MPILPNRRRLLTVLLRAALAAWFASGSAAGALAADLYQGNPIEVNYADLKYVWSLNNGMSLEQGDY